MNPTLHSRSWTHGRLPRSTKRPIRVTHALDRRGRQTPSVFPLRRSSKRLRNRTKCTAKRIPSVHTYRCHFYHNQIVKERPPKPQTPDLGTCRFDRRRTRQHDFVEERVSCRTILHFACQWEPLNISALENLVKGQNPRISRRPPPKSKLLSPSIEGAPSCATDIISAAPRPASHWRSENGQRPVSPPGGGSDPACNRCVGIHFPPSRMTSRFRCSAEGWW